MLGLLAVVGVQSGETWRLVGEARQEEGEWLPLVSQADSFDTLSSCCPRDLLPGLPGQESDPRPAMVGGVARAADGDCYISLTALSFTSSSQPELECVLRVFINSEEGRLEERLMRTRLEADLEANCYWAGFAHTNQFGWPTRTVELRFRAEYRTSQPQLIWENDSYGWLGSERFRLLFLPQPELGVIRLETSADARLWRASAVLPTWFEHSQTAPVFGPTWRYWFGDGPGRAPHRFFRITQAGVSPTTNAIVDSAIAVDGFNAEGEVISFGADADEVVVRARWSTSGSLPALVQLGVTDGSTAAWVTQQATSSPQVFTDVIRLPAGGTNWTLFVRPAE